MSIDSVNEKEKAKQDINWSTLIEHSEAEIKACRDKIKTLTKSLVFFKKQADSGIPFPLKKDARHKELS
jgi:hypothetical protein